jgi:hypothetical protein
MGGGKQTGSEQLEELRIDRTLSFHELWAKKDRLGPWGGKGGRSTKHPKALGYS